MKIDKEGHKIIANSFVTLSLISAASALWLPMQAAIVISGISLLFWLFVIRFFRVPARERHTNPNAIYSPADGTIVVVEKTYESEYLKEERIQVSVFMSIWNVHANWYPMDGDITYFKHHHGRFLVAWHPKSSTENERTTTVLRGDKHTILFRQIAGFVARRIVSYAAIGRTIKQNSRCGFIKFGSRVDLYLPLGSEVKVKLGDKVTGTQTILAILPEAPSNTFNSSSGSNSINSNCNSSDVSINE